MRHPMAPDRHSDKGWDARTDREFSGTRIRPADRSIAVLAALALILTAIAYRALFEVANPDLGQEIEGLLFHSTSTGPLVVLMIAIWLLYRRWDRLRRPR